MAEAYKPKDPEDGTILDGSAHTAREVFDYLLWDRLSNFWRSYYPETDREVLEALYEACSYVLDAEMVRLSQLNDAKGILACPIFSQRRWVKLNLSRYGDLKKFLRFVFLGRDAASGRDAESDRDDRDDGGVSGMGPDSSGSVPGDSSAGRPGVEADPASLESTGLHWHISVMVPGTARTLPIGYRTLPALVKGWKYRMSPSGQWLGEKLTYGTDYVLSSGGRAIVLRTAAEAFEFDIGLDVSDLETFGGTVPQALVAEYRAPETRLDTPSYFASMPLFVELLTEVGPDDAPFLETNLDYAVQRKTYSPASTPDQGVVSLLNALAFPGETSTQWKTAIIFGMRKLDGVDESAVPEIRHEHRRISCVIARDSAPNPPTAGLLIRVPDSTSVVFEVQIPEFIPLGRFDTMNFLPRSFHVFVNGKKLHPREYTFSSSDSVLRVNRGIDVSTPSTVEVLYTVETDDYVQSDLLHSHYAYSHAVEAFLGAFPRFDDGGYFDYDPDEYTFPPAGIYDAERQLLAVQLPATVDESDELEVYCDGVLQYPSRYQFRKVRRGQDWINVLVLKTSVRPKHVDIFFRRDAGAFMYGFDDIFGISFSPSGMRNSDVVARAMENIASLYASFSELFPETALDLRTARDALSLLYAGSNVLLALFEDEDAEYEKYNTDAPDQPFLRADARRLESQDTQLVTIPILVDHVARPSRRYHVGRQFDLRRGNILSNIPIGATDWWCPVLVLDEKFLANVFGIPTQILREESSKTYRDVLLSYLMLRYSGPTLRAIRNAFAVFSGSRVFKSDGVVQSVTRRAARYAITVDGGGRAAQRYYVPEAPPALSVNTPVFVGFPLLTPFYISGVLTRFFVEGDRCLVVDLADLNLSAVTAGDMVRLVVRTSETSYQRAVVAKVHVVRIEYVESHRSMMAFVHFTAPIFKRARPVGGTPFYVYRTVTLDASKLRVRASSDGVVRIIEPIYEFVVSTSGKEEYAFPSPPPWKVGDVVRSGDAVDSELARFLYDAVCPRWHRLKKRDDPTVQAVYRGAFVDWVEGTMTLVEPSVVRVRLHDRVAFHLDRGAKMTIEDRATKRRWSAVVAGGVFPVYHCFIDGYEIDGNRPVLARVETASIADAKLLWYETPANASIHSTLASPVRPGSGSITLQSGTFFPARGRVLIQSPGGSVGCVYGRRIGNELHDLVWESGAFSASSVFSPETSAVVLIGQFLEASVHPMFRGILNQMMVGSPPIDDRVLDICYDIVRMSAMVVETSGTLVSEFTQVLRDALPPGMLVMRGVRHICDDAVHMGATDA